MGGNYYRDQRPYGKPPGTDFERKEEQKQQLADYFIVLDLEGKHEVLEFPAALVNTKSLEVEDTFHRCAITSSPCLRRTLRAHVLVM